MMMNWLVQRAYAATAAPGTWNWLNPVAMSTNATIGGLIGSIVKIITLIAAGLAVIYLIYSGIIYITAAGNPEAAKKGQQGVINAVIGIIIIVAAYFIINVAMSAAGLFGTT